MKIIITQGCTAGGIEFDGVRGEDLTKEQSDSIIDYLLPKVKEGINDGTILLTNLVELFQPDEWGSDNNVCEQCGDFVSWNEYNI